MSKISDSKSISEITIPGTHDTAAHKSFSILQAAQTQSTTTTEQLNYGIRFLDVRAKAEAFVSPPLIAAPYPSFSQPLPATGAKLTPYHGFVPEGEDVREILDSCKTFLRDNPTETIIMSLKNEEDGDDIFFLIRFKLGHLRRRLFLVAPTFMVGIGGG